MSRFRCYLVCARPSIVLENKFRSNFNATRVPHSDFLLLAVDRIDNTRFNVYTNDFKLDNVSS